jgi:hypothetical protein
VEQLKWWSFDGQEINMSDVSVCPMSFCILELGGEGEQSFSLGLCASLAGYFTLLSLTNLATVFMFFKLPNLVVCFQETPTFHIHEHCNNMTSRFFLKSLMCV